MSAFESVRIDTETQEIDATGYDVTSGRPTSRTFAFADCMGFNEWSEPLFMHEGFESLSIAPFPYSGWGSLEGYYHLEIQASCSSGSCRW